MFRLTLEPSSGSNVSTYVKLHLWFGGVVQANVVSIMAAYTGLLCVRALCRAGRDCLPARHTARTHNKPVYLPECCNLSEDIQQTC
jgi:hypothetical protein